MKRAASVFVLMAFAIVLSAGFCLASATEEAPAAEGYYITGKVLSYSSGVSITLDVDGENVVIEIAENCAAPETLDTGTEVDVEVMNEKAVSIMVL